MNKIIESLKVNKADIIQYNEDRENFENELSYLMSQGYELMPNNVLRIEDKNDIVVFLKKIEITNEDTLRVEAYNFAKSRGLRAELIDFNYCKIEDIKQALNIVYLMNSIVDLLADKEIKQKELDKYISKMNKQNKNKISNCTNMYELFCVLYDLLMDNNELNEPSIFFNDDEFLTVNNLRFCDSHIMKEVNFLLSQPFVTVA